MMMLTDPWQESWSAAIVNHIWQSTLVVLVAWLLTLLLRRNQARTRHCIWMAASLKFLIPFSLLTFLGEWLRPATAPPLASSHLTTMVKVADPFLQTTAPVEPDLVAFSPAAVIAPAPHHGVPLSGILLALWLCGVLFLLLRWSRQWWTLRATIRSASPISLPMDAPVLLTPRIIEPGVVGILHPVLLLPEKILDRLSPAQLRSILAHESCHVRRRDNLTALVHMAVEAIFWFHPAVWWIERRLIEERERACDEAVLQLGNEAEVYAESILSVCRFYTESPIVYMSGVTGSELKQRIVRIIANQPALKLNLARKALLCTVSIAAISGPIVFGLLHITEVHAQTAPASQSNGIAATWQGVLHTNRDLHIVVKIANAADGTLHGTFYNLDTQPDGIPIMSTRLTGSLLKLELPFATYQGSLSPDRNSMTGTWLQGQNPLPLTFARATSATEWTIPHRPHMAPMAANADPSFEVATIKPSTPEEHGPRFVIDGRHFSVIHTSLSDLVNFAYRIQQRQIANAPDWFTSERYDISAESSGEGEPSPKQWQSMVKKLMADRFQVKSHYEKREFPVYALTVAKTGPKLNLSQGDPNGSAGLGFGPPGHFGATNATMADVADAIGFAIVDRPVVDQTGLTGRFDLRLTWTPDTMHAATENPSAPPDIFTAIQEELGLKLVSTKAPVDVLVIDRVQRPSAN